MQNNERNLIGYANKPPHPQWPNDARIAINFVINYEEGSETNILDGDECAEQYLTEIPNPNPIAGQRHLSVESCFAYGSRCGVWRLVKLFDDYHVPVTFFATGLALSRNNQLAAYLKSSEHEIAGHGYRWINYRDMPIDEEREHIKKTLSIIESNTGKKVHGWYTGRRSANTRELIIEQGLSYDSEDYSDDLPYWTTINNKQHLIIPYTFNLNDCKYLLNPGWTSSQTFYEELIAEFDCLYREGKTTAKMMTIALHARISGHPARSEAIRRFLDYIKRYNAVWLCRRQDIAQHWQQHHKAAE